MMNECHFLASVDICRKCVLCPFDPWTRRSSLGNLRCLCVLRLFFSFVKVIRFSCVQNHSFLMRWPMWHSNECRISLRMTNECHFLAYPVDICRNCVSCPFGPMIGSSSLALFVRVTFLLCQHHSLSMC